MSRHRKTDKPGLVDKVRAMAALASIPGLSPAEIKVALRLLDHFNCGTGRCDPSVGTIAEATGHDSRTVSRAIGQLEAHGLFHVTRRSGRHRSNSYRPDFTRFNAKTPAISSSFQVRADETAQNPATRSGNTGGMIPENPVEWPDKTIKETIKKLGEATPNVGAVQGSACEGSVRQGEPNSNQTSQIAWAAWYRWLEEDVGIKSPMVWLLKQFTRVQSQANVGPREAERLVDSVLQQALAAGVTEARLLQMIEDAIIQSHDKRGDERPKPNASGFAGGPNSGKHPRRSPRTAKAGEGMTVETDDPEPDSEVVTKLAAPERGSDLRCLERSTIGDDEAAARESCHTNDFIPAGLKECVNPGDKMATESVG